jgi:hypothetical protein
MNKELSVCAQSLMQEVGLLRESMPSGKDGSLSLRLLLVQILCTQISLAALGVPLSSNVDGKKCPTGVKI